jgi:hypothetical protein
MSDAQDPSRAPSTLYSLSSPPRNSHFYRSVQLASRPLLPHGSRFSMKSEKIRPIAGNDRPFLSSPRGSLVEALGACGKGLQRTAWEPLADLGALFIACATWWGRCNVAYLPRLSSPISGQFLVLIFRNEYLENADQAHGIGDDAPQVAPFKRHSGPVARQHRLRKAPDFS